MLFKIWLEVSNEEQERRFKARIEDPRRQWKLSPVDLPSRERWYDYSRARDLMLDATGIAYASGSYDFAHKTLTAIAGLGGDGRVPVIGLPQRLSPRDAALVNGVLEKDGDTFTGKLGGRVVTPDRR